MIVILNMPGIPTETYRVPDDDGLAMISDVAARVQNFAFSAMRYGRGHEGLVFEVFHDESPFNAETLAAAKVECPS